MKPLNLFFGTSILFFTTVTSCKKDDNNNAPQTLYRKAVVLGSDSIRSFVTLDKSGQPLSIGVELGENALNNLPADTMPGMPDYMHPVPLPQFSNTTGVDHIEVDWNPFGHEPISPDTLRDRETKAECAGFFPRDHS